MGLDEAAKGQEIGACEAKLIQTDAVVSSREIHALSGVRFAGFEHHP